MRQTKKITLSAILVAMSVAFMAVGSLIEVLDLSVCAVVSLLVVFVYLEIGGAYPWLLWICTSVLAFIICPNKLLAVEYFLVFGVYPILKAYIERLPRMLWWPVKLAFMNIVIWALFFIVEFIFGLNIFETEGGFIWKVALYVLMNVAFIVYDMFITIMVRLYYEKFRKRFLRFLK